MDGRYVLAEAVYVVAVAVTILVLNMIGEVRLGVYISFATLIYLIEHALLRPKRRFIDVSAIMLILLFAYFVAQRIMEVVFGA